MAEPGGGFDSLDRRNFRPADPYSPIKEPSSSKVPKNITEIINDKKTVRLFTAICVGGLKMPCMIRNVQKPRIIKLKL